MIRLEKGSEPTCYTTLDVGALIEKFIDTGESVWHIDELKEALRKTSYGKCAFCECELGVESKYLEVEHFRCKKKYPKEVLDWANLLPACRRCNGRKGTHDVEVSPIVNPYTDTPADYFVMRDYRLRSASQKGRDTIDVLELNNSERVVLSRFRIGEQLHEMLTVAADRLDTYKQNGSTKSKNRFLSMLEKLLGESQPAAAYAATTATLLHSNEIYNRLETECRMLGIWSEEIQRLHENSSKLKL